MMLILTGILTLVFVFALGVQIAGLIGMVRFYFRKPAELEDSSSQKLPSVTLIKPCHFFRDQEDRNFEIFFKQTYSGPIEILFSVVAADAPIVPVVKKLIEKYPNVDAKLIVTQDKRAPWRKMDALLAAQAQAKHEAIIWTDSDVVVTKRFVELVVSSLQEKDVGLVTVPEYDGGANNFASGLKMLGNNADCGVYLMGMDFLGRRAGIAFGHMVGFWKKDYDDIRASVEPKLLRTFSDGVVLGKAMLKEGKKLIYRNIPVYCRYSDKTLEDVFSQKERFAQSQKAFFDNPIWYITLGMASYPEIPAFALTVLSGFAPLHILLLMLGSSLRIGVAFFFEVLFLDAFAASKKWFWTVPVWDLLQIYFFINGYREKTLSVHGVPHRIVDRIYLEK